MQTDSTGEFTYAHRPVIRRSYTATWNGRASYQEPYAHVLPKVSLRVISARNGQYRVTLQAQAAHVSRVVRFQRLVSGSRWANVKKIQPRGSTLSAQFTARLPQGTHRVRISVPQTPGYLRATSAFVLVRR